MAYSKISEEGETFRLKRKWQIALRRYIIEQKPCTDYAMFFGLPIYLFRDWIEMQFDEGINWNNFGNAWQLDHIMPVTYFDFQSEADLLLCWNFCNVRVQRVEKRQDPLFRVDVVAAKSYFTRVYDETGYLICKKMVEKIELIENSQMSVQDELKVFILKNQITLSDLKYFESADYDRVNGGITVVDRIAEKNMLKKFGK